MTGEEVIDATGPAPTRVADAMVTIPKTVSADVTVEEARTAFEDDHVHLLLLVDDGRLEGTLTRDDLRGQPADAPARTAATTEDRTVRPDAPLGPVHASMVEEGTRRLAVVDAGERLLGLLCLKSDHTGFCDDDGVRARAAERLVRRMDPEIAAVLPDLFVLDLTDVAAARRTRVAMMERSLAGWRPDPGVAIDDVVVPGSPGHRDVRVRRYLPSEVGGGAACLLWVHGGGHVVGQPEQDDPLLSRVVAATGCVALSVDWRRPPEHPFPAPMEDCWAGLAWAHEHGASLGIDPERIVVGGASSGGGSAAGLALLARDRGLPVAFQVLVYPMLDDRQQTRSSQMVTLPQLWNTGSNAIAWNAYLGGAAGTEGVSPYAAPSRAEDLAGLPPAFIAVGDVDGFVDEDVDYAARLMQAGVPVELHVYPGAVHGFDLFAPDAAVSRRFRRDLDDVLARVLSTR